jgi:protein tyrosine phosphatase
MVLDTIARGMIKLCSVAKVTKFSKDDAQLIVNDLKSQRLITVEVKKGVLVIRKLNFLLHKQEQEY